jgi:hypothetical protein
MQSEERDLIVGLFERLRPFDAQPRDPEAERLIANLVVRQTSAPYLLTQTVLVQEQALKAAQARITELEAKATGGGGGFLASAPGIGPSNVGPWGAKPADPPPPAVQPTPGPFTRGGGFLQSAMATAAGVAGGALLFEGIRGLFGHMGGGMAQASPLMPPHNMREQLSSADLAQDDGAADDYDLTDDNSGFDGPDDL